MKTLEEIKKILPHRYPFLLIDRLQEVREGEYCRALKNISGNEEIFQGHFPQQAVFPGVMIIEALAQAAYLSSASMSYSQRGAWDDWDQGQQVPS